MIINKAPKYLILILLLALSSCNPPPKQKKIESAEEYKSEIENLLLSSNEALLKKAYIIDNDIAAQHHYNYADSLINVVKNESGNFNFEQSLAKIYNAGAHIFFGMAYTRTIYLHAELPIMNFMVVRKNKMNRLDLLLDNYLHTADSLVIIQLKNAWIDSMINFILVSKNPLYDQMNLDFEKYLALNDSIINEYNIDDAYKILSLESEKALYMQLMLITIDIIKSKNQDDMQALTDFFYSGNSMSAVYDNMPNIYDSVLTLKPVDYYEHFYNSETVVYRLFKEIARLI